MTTEAAAQGALYIHFCSFCGKDSDAVFLLIAGPSVFICNECIELCNDIINARRAAFIEVDSWDAAALCASKGEACS